MTLKALLLDVDGTLLDTREFILAAFEHAGRRHGLSLPGREVMTRQVGLPLEEIYAQYAEARLVPDLVDTHRSFQKDNLELIEPFPGVAGVLAELRALGLRLAAVSSRSHRTMIPSLEAGGIGEFLEAVVAAEDAPALKPDPAPLRLALERLGLDLGGAVMVGDTIHDVQAARALGIRSVGATYGFHGTAVLDAAPDWQIDEFAAIVPLVADLLG